MQNLPIELWNNRSASSNKSLCLLQKPSTQHTRDAFSRTQTQHGMQREWHVSSLPWHLLISCLPTAAVRFSRALGISTSDYIFHIRIGLQLVVPAVAIAFDIFVVTMTLKKCTHHFLEMRKVRQFSLTQLLLRDGVFSGHSSNADKLSLTCPKVSCTFC